MVGPKVQDLIQRDVDGVLTEKESAALGSALKKSAEARRLHRELEAMAASLVALRSFDLPPALGTRIKGSLRNAFPADFTPPPVAVRIPKSERLWLKTASVFSTGFAMGIVALFLVGRPDTNGGVSPTTASGSLVPQQLIVPIHFGSTDGSVVLTHRDGESDLAVRVNVPDGLILRVEYNAALLNVAGIHGPSGRSGVLTVRDGRVESVGKGVQEFGMTVSPRGAGAALSVSIISRERELFRKAIPIGG